MTARLRPGDGLAASSGQPGRGGRPGGGPTPPDAPGSGSHWRTIFGLVRAHPLEIVAILLLGLGGLIAPFPLWLLGAVAVLASRLWDARDKWAALAVPTAFALIGAIAIAGLTARSGSLAGYFRTVRIDGWDLVRAGSVVAAGYLAWRVRQGRRPRREPPWRRPPRG
jgi:hypothetical protein